MSDHRIKISKICFFVLSLFVIACKSPEPSSLNAQDPLFLKEDTITGSFAYYDQHGKKILGDYKMAFTDTLTGFAIVADSGFVLINRKGEHLFQIFTYDNGPDYPSDGLYRIVKDNKIGYVDALTSLLVIEPVYSCAYPFENGKAKVSLKCKTINDGEHPSWESEKWFYIDKKGKKLE